jgi:hypothetical protein
MWSSACRRYLTPTRILRRRRSENGSVELSRRVREVVGYPPLVEMNVGQRREFHEALLEADTLDDVPGKWQAAILSAEDNRPKLRVVGDD